MKSRREHIPPKSSAVRVLTRLAGEGFKVGEVERETRA